MNRQADDPADALDRGDGSSGAVRSKYGEALVASTRDHKPAFLAVAVATLGLIVWVTVAPRIHDGCSDWVPTAWVPWTSAGLVAHGWLGSMYRGMPGIPEFPLWPIVLAPFWALAHWLNLSGGFVHYTEIGACGFSSALDIYGPVSIAGCSILAFAVDHVAKRIGVSMARRWYLAFCIGGLIWYADVYNGHPEDVMAVGLALLSAWNAWEGRYRRSGWYMSLGLVMQPLVVPLLPVVLVAVGFRRWGPFLWRAAFLPVALIGPSFLVSPGATWTDVVVQPIIPLHLPAGPLKFLQVPLSSLPANATPLRSVTVLAGIATAVWLGRRLRTGAPFATLLVASAAVLSVRDIVEGTVNDYYIVPALVFALVASSTRKGWRLPVVSLLVLTALLVEIPSMPWQVWWIPVMSSSWVAIACGSGIGSRRRQGERASVSDTHDDARMIRRSPESAEGAPAAVASSGRTSSRKFEAAFVTVVLVAVTASAVYSSSTTSSQDRYVAQGWFRLIDDARLQKAFAPDLQAPDDAAFVLDKGRWTQITTVAPPTRMSSALVAKLERWRADADRVTEEFLALAWGVPQGRSAPDHVSASEWISTLGDRRAPQYPSWIDGPASCSRPPSKTGSLFDPSYGAPDFRILLWVTGCGANTLWADETPGFQISGFVSKSALQPSAIIETDPTMTTMVSAFVPYAVAAGLKVTVQHGGVPTLGEPGAVGAMTAELRWSGSSLRIWNPWYSDHLTQSSSVSPGTIPGALPGTVLKNTPSARPIP